MTAQDLFNKVYSGLASQGWQSSMNGPECAYRGEDGRKCAIGHLIPDTIAARADSLGIVDVDELCERYRGARDIIGRHLMLADEMQLAHDQAPGPQDMRQSFVSLAKRWGLTVPALADKDGAA